MGLEDVSQLTYALICKIYKRYSRGASRLGKGPRDMNYLVYFENEMKEEI
jgi:hypothetical protein